MAGLVGRKFKADGTKLRLPKGDYVVIDQSKSYASGPWGSFSDLTVKNVLTGKEFQIPTGNAQLIFGLY